MNSYAVLAFDFGASSARAIKGVLEDGCLSVQEVHRFENIPIEQNGTLYWDIEELFGRAKTLLFMPDLFSYKLTGKPCCEATDWCRANYEYFRGGGFSSHFRTGGEMHTTIDVRTDRTWPTTWFAPNLTGHGAFSDVYSVMANWGANHGVTVYGHVGADLITLASMLRIPVAMHNVSEDKIYRPHAWSAFGTDNKEAADYKACAAYGSLYR